jgi:ATP-dependent DNA helicase RecQ
VAQTLGELYGIQSRRWPVRVTQVCGGCPADRFDKARHIDYRVPIAVPLHDVQSNDMSAWTAHFPWLDPALLFVFFDDSPARALPEAAIVSFLSWLVGECGFQEIATRERSQLAHIPEVLSLYRKSPQRVLLHRSDLPDEEPYSPLSRITLLEAPVSAADLSTVRMLQRPIHIVLLPKSTSDPDNESRLLADTIMYSARLDQLLPVLMQ